MNVLLRIKPNTVNAPNIIPYNITSSSDIPYFRNKINTIGDITVEVIQHIIPNILKKCQASVNCTGLFMVNNHKNFHFTLPCFVSRLTYLFNQPLLVFHHSVLGKILLPE